MRFATVWQSMAQIRSRYRDSADSILANSTTKLFMGPEGDEATLSFLSRLLGDDRRESTSRRSNRETTSIRPKASAPELQQLDADRAILIEGRMAPAVIKLLPWWDDRELVRRART